MKPGYPSMRMLTSRLREMLSRDGLTCEAVDIVDRSPEPCTSSFPSEIVTCRPGNRDVLTLFCKYSRPERGQLPALHAAHGHRHGPGYEGRVYRHVLAPLSMATPRLWGTYEGTGGRAWLALEYLDSSMRIQSAASGPERAAAWIGQFHARNETRLSEPAVQFLSTYPARKHHVVAAGRPARKRIRRGARKVSASGSPA